MREAVVTQVIAERTLGQLAVGVDRAGDAEIGLGIDRQSARASESSASAGRRARRQTTSSDRPSGSGITAATVKRRRPADEDIDPQRLAAANRRSMMHADAAMNLIVQPDLDVRPILTAGKLHAIHAQVRPLASPADRHLRCRPAAA